MIQEMLAKQEHEIRPQTSLTRVIRNQARIDPRIRISDPTQADLERKEAVKNILDNFKASLKKIVDPAIALREAGASMETVKKLL